MAHSTIEVDSRPSLFETIVAHCKGGVRPGKSPDFPLFGFDNAKFFMPLVTTALDDIRHDFRTRKGGEFKLIDSVDHTIYEATITHFGRDQAWAVVKGAADAGLTEAHIERFKELFDPESLFWMDSTALPSSTSPIDRIVRRMARIILIIELYTFLVEHGHDWNETRF